MTGEQPWRTAMIGFGRIAAGYADDPAMARHYRYATHAQALRAHPAFAWSAAIDPSEAARRAAREQWGVEAVAASPDALPGREAIEVAVMASPPEARRGVLEAFPNLRAVLVEKPLALDVADARSFLDSCRRRGILVQVNLPRRADATMRALADGRLAERIGPVQAGFAVYGNGLRNNGTHLVDWLRQLVGEPVCVQAWPGGFREGPIEGDVNLSFTMMMACGCRIMVHPLRFSHYREVGLDLWGERGRLSLWHEGLTLMLSAAQPNRAASAEREIASDDPAVETTTVGEALYAMYDNLADALTGRAALVSSGENALRTAQVVAAIECSAASAGVEIAMA